MNKLQTDFLKDLKKTLNKHGYSIALTDDGSDGFVIAYDEAEVNIVVEQLKKENKKLTTILGEIDKTYVSEYDGRTYEYCTFCGCDIDEALHDKDCYALTKDKE